MLIILRLKNFEENLSELWANIELGENFRCLELSGMGRKLPIALKRNHEIGFENGTNEITIQHRKRNEN